MIRPERLVPESILNACRVLLLAVFAYAASASPAVAEEGGLRAGRVHLQPYIEAAQVLSAELSPGNDTVTYTRLAAGVDATISGRTGAGAVSVRYERRIGWSDDAPDGDLISGIARVSAAVVPHVLSVEAGGLATRTRIEGNGGAVISPLDNGDQTSDLYALYAGPSLRTHAGDVAIQADYRIGYSRLEEPDSIVTLPGAEPVDVFDDSTVHFANVRAAARPGSVLPVGVGIGAGWYREDISNFDQRIDDRHARADVTVPVSPTFALVGGVGYEKVRISNRDIVLGADGLPVVGKDGRYVTDKASPRLISYDVDGVIWDAGFIWRPSGRTSLEAHVGRRYGSTTYYGSFGWQPTRRSSLNISVYDSLAGFGGRLNTALVALPTQFTANRNPVTGDLSGCVASMEKGSCLGGALGSIRSATFRSRGVAATYALDLGRIQTGIGAGYDRRRFHAARGTMLDVANGIVDENVWVAAYLNGRIDDRSSFSTNVYANWFDSGFDLAGSATAFGATAAYHRLLTGRLSATAAIGLDGISRTNLEDVWTASALVGMRYNF